jgi:hypothetical protein
VRVCVCVWVYVCYLVDAQCDLVQSHLVRSDPEVHALLLQEVYGSGFRLRHLVGSDPEVHALFLQEFVHHVDTGEYELIAPKVI